MFSRFLSRYIEHSMTRIPMHQSNFANCLKNSQFVVNQTFCIRPTDLHQQAFHDIFSDLLKVLEKYNQPLLVPVTSIEYTIEKCRLFQQKFGVLSEVTTRRTIRQGLAFGLRTLQWSFQAEKVANDLRTELASLTRTLSLRIDTLNVRNALDGRAENYQIREQNREILRRLQAQREQDGITEEVDLSLPDVPQHLPSHHIQLNLPEVPRHQPTALETVSNTRLANLDAVCRDLEALESFLGTEGRIIAETQSSAKDRSHSNGASDFINLARHEIEVQHERAINYQKRMQNLSYRLGTLDNVSTEIVSRNNSWDLPELASEQNVSESSSLRPGQRNRFMFSNTSPTNATGTRTGTATGLSLSTPIEESSLVSSSRQDSVSRRGVNLPDNASITLQRYLERFETELEELDQHDVEGQIARTREELFDLVQRSFPPSPDPHLSPTSPIGSSRVSPSIQGMLASSPPSSFGALRSPQRRETLQTNTSRRQSIAGDLWRYLAKDVKINNITYSCFKCTSVETAALQMAQRSSGGFSFRLLCMGSGHRPTDGLLFRHDLSSTAPSYPQVYHKAANRGSDNCVHVLGLPSRLEAYVPGRRKLLDVQPPIRPCYKFASSEDSESFQEVVHRARLVGQFDVTSVNSSAYTGHPARHITLRLWSSLTSGDLSIMFHAMLVDKCGPFAYIENALSFLPPSTKGNKIKLKLTDTIQTTTSRQKRVNSRDSGVSGIGSSSDDATINGITPPVAASKIRWIEIEFVDHTDRDAFLRSWSGLPV